MTLDEALARIETRIKEHDGYVFYMKDGCLVRDRAESATSAASQEASGRR